MKDRLQQALLALCQIEGHHFHAIMPPVHFVSEPEPEQIEQCCKCRLLVQRTFDLKGGTQ